MWDCGAKGVELCNAGELEDVGCVENFQSARVTARDKLLYDAGGLEYLHKATGLDYSEYLTHRSGT
jgi:hypothetical protein